MCSTAVSGASGRPRKRKWKRLRWREAHLTGNVRIVQVNPVWPSYWRHAAVWLTCYWCMDVSEADSRFQLDLHRMEGFDD